MSEAILIAIIGAVAAILAAIIGAIATVAAARIKERQHPNQTSELSMKHILITMSIAGFIGLVLGIFLATSIFSPETPNQNQPQSSSSSTVPNNSSSSIPRTSSKKDGTLIFSENFERGEESLNGWERTHEHEKIEVVNCGQYGKCLKISRNDRNGITFLTKRFHNLTGTLFIEAMLKAENVVKGTAPFANGKLSIVVETPGNTDWRQAQFYSNDFEGTLDWTLKSVEVVDLDGTKEVKIEFGLQSAKGAAYVDEIKVYHLP